MSFHVCGIRYNTKRMKALKKLTFFFQLFCHHNVIENCIVLIVKENINYWYAANQHSELMGQIRALSWGIFKSIKQPWKTLKDGCSRFEVMHSSIKSFIPRSIYVAELNEPHTIDRTGGKTGGRTDRLQRFRWPCGRRACEWAASMHGQLNGRDKAPACWHNVRLASS